MTTNQPNQRRLFVSMVVSLDGYIEGPKGELDWFTEGDAAFAVVRRVDREREEGPLRIAIFAIDQHRAGLGEPIGP